MSINSSLSIDSQHQVNPLAHQPSPHPDTSLVHTSLVHTSHTHTTTRSNTIPRLQRRGLLASWALLPEYEDARDYPQSAKHLITFIIALAAVTGPMGTSIMLPAIDDIVHTLHTTDSMVNVSVGVYLLSLGVFPLWWLAFSEKWGRRSVYIILFGFFFAFSFGTTYAPNILALIVLRVLQGGCSASVQALGAGTISDVFAVEERGTAMGYYYLGPLCGPFLAPILGGVLSQVWGWRATQWFLVIFSGVNFVLIVFALPETLRKNDNFAANAHKNVEHNENSQNNDENSHHSHLPLSSDQIERIASHLSRISTRHSVYEDAPIGDPVMPSLSKYTTNRSSYSRKVFNELMEEELKKSASQLPPDSPTTWQRYRTNCYDCIVRPIHSLILLTHPQIALVCSASSICFAAIYFFNMTISYEYAREPYKFRAIIIGLLYIPNSVTYIIASVIGGRWNDRLLARYAQSHNNQLDPEARLSWNIVVAFVLYMPACLIFGWTLKYGQFWLVPLIGTALCGFASMLLIGATVTYLVDSLPGKGATGVALNNFLRQILAAVATFIVEPLLASIGPGILFSIIAGLILVAGLALIVVKRYGTYFREHNDLGALYDKL
ncbi:A Q resistance multidrug resistance transporter [Suhomyces tanzawaensis NRRL Y-17324]|uniref:A Q resistance multidrug resistance transporter n=1 Tax=Suhomyces tanzawaensis NRRL Y-17324 TaxID=984487 RepID=A0A1E4SQP9_9ASCO|nr:A Q resistance multidrug resistance transporter [Suhomyces tanzawaensis NRRL Y-17324]ODV81836.1 A Q resistance multidrug resistance transporter [Suhomyces tanzawaensis NRRL Y-17324]